MTRIAAVFTCILICSLADTGCSSPDNSPSGQSSSEVSASESDSSSADQSTEEQELYQLALRAARSCAGITEDPSFSSATGDATDANGKDDSETVRELLGALEADGFCASDTDNLYNMVNYNQMDTFCRASEEGKKADADLILLMDTDGFVCYHFHTADKIINVRRCTLYWSDGTPGYYEAFQAERWTYTEKGYFFFDQHRMPGYDGPPGEIVIRVRPIEETCLQYNRKYVLPVGYSRNNMLISDWSETDGFGDLNFYDLYDIFYPMKYKEPVPYVHEFTGAEYEIPSSEFETVLSDYLNVSADTIRARTVYHPDTDTYLYHPRGLGDAEYPYAPSPEVTACEKRDDGTLLLTVNAVWATGFTDSAAISVLTVRPLPDGRFQYVSNQVIHLQEGIGGSWYSPRLTEEEWRAAYGK